MLKTKVLTSEEEVSFSDDNISFDDDSDLPLTDNNNALVDEGAAAGDNALRVWMNIVGDDLGPPNVEFTVNSGPRIHLPRDSEPVDYLQLFITNFSLDKIVTETNRHAQKWIEGEDISVDESMVGFRGKTPHLRQYMPLKHHARFGIKLWCVCDSNLNYTVNFEIYKGAHNEADRSEENVTHNLVIRLLQEARLLYSGHHVGVDNYFSSPKLFLEIYRANTKATGTVRSNRKGLPKAILKKNTA
ncbi:PiggyBac transposable element-derived protein 4 [Plakobranchus ocellatus]|uniref:PiggyBac transposable element-derived protein 4 n=1 Tax=Plakobranchus ocellatus TaxID=259542 RepID=A0AAV4CJA3_9GAST|nr:PiggyBac transposable element-derived protein 4 [Plakobranchus ocellatus]